MTTPPAKRAKVEALNTADLQHAELNATLLRRRADEFADRAYHRQQRDTLLAQMSWGCCLLNLGTAVAALTYLKGTVQGVYWIPTAFALFAYGYGFLSSVRAHAALVLRHAKHSVSAETLIRSVDQALLKRSALTENSERLAAVQELGEDNALFKVDADRALEPTDAVADLLFSGLAAWSTGMGLVLSALAGPSWFDFAGKLTWLLLHKS